MPSQEAIKRAKQQFQAELTRMAPAIGRTVSGECVGNCGLGATEGDIFCPGCREAYDRDPSWIREVYPAPAATHVEHDPDLDGDGNCRECSREVARAARL